MFIYLNEDIVKYLLFKSKKTSQHVHRYTTAQPMMNKVGKPDVCYMYYYNCADCGEKIIVEEHKTHDEWIDIEIGPGISYQVCKECGIEKSLVE